MDYIDKLRDKIRQVIDEEYKKYKYVPHKKDTEEQTDKPQKESINYDMLKLNSQLIKMAKRKEYKNKKTNENKKEVEGDNVYLSIKDDLYNIIDDNKSYIEWKNIPMDEKKELIKKYIEAIEKDNNKMISDVIRQSIIEAIENKKILYKKDINYDKINKKILNLYGLTFVNDNYEFTTVPNKNKKKNLIGEMTKKIS
jgi:hypothetical protein